MTALSAVDTLALLDDKLQLTLGLRAQQVHQKLANYKETAVTLWWAWWPSPGASRYRSTVTTWKA